MFEGFYPYTIQFHLVPVLKLMALINPQFQKLASFLSLDIFTDRHGVVNPESGEQIRKLPGFPLIIGKYLVFNVKNL